ncbi:sulfurtransferase TusA family protein [Methanohalobium sp.]|uniref:sulfurtransferase TusA family protein n=1 Tax=Methanohalobium sp. TaxID=2837493 RepID=UPI0025E68099|nr:sulfurtransferase TusA family protein [Methanohalobium sp.]
MKYEIDLQGEVCPYTFVKTKLKLEELENSDILTVTFDHPPAINNVSRSVKNEGHKVLGIDNINNMQWKIHIKKLGKEL